MKIYIAGTFQDQKELRKEAATLWELGHEVVGTWLNEIARPANMDHETFQRKLALKDIAECVSAELIILDNRRSSGGKNVEWGIGLGNFQNKILWLVGNSSNVFHQLADLKFSNWDEVRRELGEGKEITKHIV